VNQLRYKVNESAPVDVIWTADQIRGVPYILFEPRGDQSKYYDLYDVMKNVVGRQAPLSSFPVKKFSVPVDPAAAVQFGGVNANDSLASQIEIEIPEGKSYMSLDQLTMLNIIAANGWKRPICFTSPYGEIGFGPYLRQEGMIFRFIPARQQPRTMELNRTDSLLRNVFKFGNAQTPGVYFDEENRRHLLTIRQTYAVAATNLALQGRKQEAVNLLQKVDQGISTENVPYAMVSRFQSHNQVAAMMLEAAYQAGHTTLAAKISSALKKDISEQLAYFNYLKAEKPESYPGFVNDEETLQNFLRFVEDAEKRYNPATIIKEQPGKPVPDSNR
jgi:hypothetical protein